MTQNELDALQYVVNTGYNATVEAFDDDFEPVGPLLRANLMPRYMVVNDQDKIQLTEDGVRALEERG
jgi:hypothetical protein